MSTAVPLGICLALMLGSVLGLLAVDRRALRPVMTTAALVIALGGYFAALLH